MRERGAVQVQRTAGLGLLRWKRRRQSTFSTWIWTRSTWRTAGRTRPLNPIRSGRRWEAAIWWAGDRYALRATPLRVPGTTADINCCTKSAFTVAARIMLSQFGNVDLTDIRQLVQISRTQAGYAIDAPVNLVAFSAARPSHTWPPWRRRKCRVPIQALSDDKTKIVDRDDLQIRTIAVRHFVADCAPGNNKATQSRINGLTDYPNRPKRRGKLCAELYTAGCFIVDHTITSAVVINRIPQNPRLDRRSTHNHIGKSVRNSLEQIGILYRRRCSPGLNLSCQLWHKANDTAQVDLPSAERAITTRASTDDMKLTTRQRSQSPPTYAGTSEQLSATYSRRLKICKPPIIHSSFIFLDHVNRDTAGKIYILNNATTLKPRPHLTLTDIAISRRDT